MNFYQNAPLFMTISTLYFSLLPILLYYAVRYAKNGEIKKHRTSQISIFFITLVIVFVFELEVRIYGGFFRFLNDSFVPYSFLSKFLIVHIAVATVTLFLWIYLIIKSYFSFKNNRDFFRKKHKVLGVILFFGICVSSLMGLLMYIFLFVRF